MATLPLGTLPDSEMGRQEAGHSGADAAVAAGRQHPAAALGAQGRRKCSARRQGPPPLRVLTFPRRRRCRRRRMACLSPWPRHRQAETRAPCYGGLWAAVYRARPGQRACGLCGPGLSGAGRCGGRGVPCCLQRRLQGKLIQSPLSPGPCWPLLSVNSRPLLYKARM